MLQSRKISWPKLFGLFALFLFLLGLTPGLFPVLSAQAASLAELKKPYTHSSQSEPISALLADFAANQGFNAVFTSSVQGLVSGEFNQMSPKQFLSSMHSGFGVEAYTLGSSMFFFHQSERRRQVMRITSMQPSNMRKMLLRMEALSPDLHVATSNDDHLLFFEGPDDYTASLLTSIQAIEASQLGEMEIRVFRLKHSWADDTTIEAASSSTTIPGLATILRAIITGQPAPVAQTMHRSGGSGKLMGSGLIPSREQPKDKAAAPAAVANIVADPRTNSLIITDQKYRMQYYESIIAELDRPVDLIEIHAAIVDINANYAYELGIGWGADIGGRRFGGSTGSVGAPSSSLPGSADSGLSMTTILSSGVNTFFSNIRAMEDSGRAATLARPSILTMDNVQASLEYTTTFYVRLEGNESVDLVDVTSGTSLKVTPRIIRLPDGSPSSLNLLLNIMDGSDPVQSDKANWVTDVPPVKKVTINTQATVKQGQSLLVGGFYYELRQDGKTGSPGLMDMRVVGNLFRDTKEEVQRMERLILITPRIITYDMLGSQDTNIPRRVMEQNFGVDPTSPGYTLNENNLTLKAKSGCFSGAGSVFVEPLPVRQQSAQETDAPKADILNADIPQADIPKINTKPNVVILKADTPKPVTAKPAPAKPDKPKVNTQKAAPPKPNKPRVNTQRAAIYKPDKPKTVIPKADIAKADIPDRQ
ncbi:MAG: type III secretion system outer membrane ring subunit SctC [Deltaproteobacteria bacterium]|jgi:type III secretion protein C|nr:type III secretion system outer membrane ring subunit SctC [Deltaproteobacteria bacterium]